MVKFTQSQTDRQAATFWGVLGLITSIAVIVALVLG